MPYTNNESAIFRVKKYLDQMAEATTSLEWEAEQPHKLAFHIREGIAVARKTGNPLGNLAGKFIIRSLSNKVVAQLRVNDPNFVELKRTLNKMVFDDLDNLLEVVGAAIKHKADVMYFPNADLIPEDLQKLFAWTSKNEYFVVVGDGVTITRVDPGEAKWEP